MLSKPTCQHVDSFVQPSKAKKSLFQHSFHSCWEIDCFFFGNFLVFNGARDCDIMGLVSTHQTREFLLHWLSHLPCHDTFELMLSSYHLGCFLLHFMVIFLVFAAQGPIVFIIDQLTSPWVTKASSSVHFNHQYIIFGVTGVQLTLLVAIFAIIPLLLVVFVQTDFSFLARGSKM